MGFFSNIARGLKGFFPKMIKGIKASIPKMAKGLKKLMPKIAKGLKKGLNSIKIGIQKIFKSSPKEATGRVGREVVKSGKRGRNLIKKTTKSGLFPPMK